ncbi:hypothetical protein BDA96_06G273400 [Sorghum bicolor]|jgi:speckle-type POZ protein|uniref:BTB domain-containing protein n=3 Tax=Sorghum bicolor TaxID=4558 RepID=A0A921UDQ7_SORBI|nr:hypothetical protein SORBI_3006G249900 [Sorghum bicolor]KAG0527904.1 hypothetical protein BDA96_06G273400 [Sorghum bicolor]
MGSCLSAAGDGGQAASSASSVSGTHQFTIRGYNATKGMGVGKSILTRYFTVDGRTWFARYYPDGYNMETSDFIALYVQTLYKPLCRPVRARFTFELLRPDGSVAYARRSDRPCNFDMRCSSWGIRAFVARGDLEGAELGVLHQDAIKVRCTVEVVNSQRKRGGGRPRAPVAPASDYATNAIKFLSSGTAPPFDVKFSVGGVTFEAHALVVAAQSEWFAAALYGHGAGERWVEAGLPCISISGTTPEAFQGVLHYVYHDALPEELIKAKGEAVMMPQLFEAADMFLIGRMKAICAIRLRRFINNDTVRSIMELAQAHSCEELQQACQNHLARRRRL